MTFPTDLTNTSNESGNTNSHGIDLPATVAAGALLGFWFSFDSTLGIFAPSGWTIDINIASDGHRLAFMTKDTVIGDEGGTSVTVTSSGAGQKSAHWSITTDGDAFHFGSSSSVTSTSAPNCPIVSPGVGTKDFRYYAIVGCDSSGQTITTPPSGYGSDFISEATGAGGVTLCVSHKDANSSSDDPGVYAMGNAEDSHAITMAVEPSAPSNPSASGAPSIPAIEASGVAAVRKSASGAPSITAVTASGAANGTISASGTPDIPAVTASGVAAVRKSASGTPSITAVTASGVAKAIQLANGAPSIPSIEASGVASVVPIFIAVRDEVSSDSGGSQTTSQVFTLPTTVNAGDTLLCVSGFNGATGAVTGPGGIWTSTRFIAPTGSDLVVHSAVATAGLGGTTVAYTTTNARFGSHHCWAINNGGTIVLGSAASGTDNEPNSPNNAPSGDKNRMWFPVAVFAGHSGTLDAIPVTYADGGLANRSVTSGTDGNVIFCRKVSVNTPQNPANFEATSNFSLLDWTALTIGVEEQLGDPEATGAASTPAVQGAGVAILVRTASGAATLAPVTGSGATALPGRPRVNLELDGVTDDIIALDGCADDVIALTGRTDDIITLSGEVGED